MIHYIKVYLLLLPIFFAIDFVWLGYLMGGFYKTEMGSLARTVNGALNPIYWAALLVYVLIPLGVVLFALPRVNPDQLVVSALSWGALFGIVLYGVYDLTNYSLVANWSLRLVIVDIAWGGVLNAIGCLAAALLDRRLG